MRKKTNNKKKKVDGVNVAETITYPPSDIPAGLIADELPAMEIRPTGISVLDRTLGGGLPSGSLVYIYADAISMAEVFLYQFIQARKTYYFINERRPVYVMRDIRNIGFETSNIILVDIYSEYYLTPQGDMVDNVGNEFVDTKIVEFTEDNLKKIVLEEDEEDINIIIDSFSFYLNLHVNPGVILRLANLIYEITKNLNCLSFLYGIKNTHPKEIENIILKLCDVVFDVELEKKSDRISNCLTVPKTRGRTPITEMIRFKVEEGVQIDTTKNIV